MRYAATSITMLRIIGAGVLLVIKPLSVAFYLMYMLCGISDILDGFIARKTDTVSKAGTILDSVADFIFIAAMLYILIPMLPWELWMIYWIAIVALTRCASLAVGFIKYRALAFLHTYANKATGLALFCFPLLYLVLPLSACTIILCSIASLSAIEELVINVREKELNRNIKGLFINEQI